MERIVQTYSHNGQVSNILFEGKRLDDQWDVSIWEKNGHREVSARQVVQWVEIGEVPALDKIDLLLDAELIEEKRLRSLQKAAQRAQTMCRRVIKAEGFNELLTITYRQNQTCRETAKKHFKEWVRRMKSALGGDFRYCASFEKQDRGAMHMHVACHKLPKHGVHKGVKIEGWKLGTQVWRSIVGKDNGLVFVGGKKASVSKKRVRKSPAKMAQYVSKYIMKDYADSPEESNRYSRSNGSDVPKPTHLRLTGCTLADAIGAMFECKDGDVIVSHRLGDFKDTYWLCTEPSWDEKKPVH
jgi:hypothetical protein